MAISDIIQPGDKVEARLTSKTNDANKIYRSNVLEVKDEGKIVISMPIESGKIILLPLGGRFEFTFLTGAGGTYKSIGQVTERYKKDNIFMLEIELKTRLEKFQRREYFRHNCMLEVIYFILDEEQKKLETTEDVVKSLRNAVGFVAERHYGLIADLSGGGMKMRTKEELTEGDQLLFFLKLTSDSVDSQYQVRGDVIGSRVIETSSSKTLYENRIKFVIEDNTVREDIIRYIFEEERRIRRKENG